MAHDARRAEEDPELYAAMKNTERGPAGAQMVAQALYWVHLTWLVAIPFLAVLSTWYLLDEVTSAWGWMLVPTLVYLGVIIQSYKLKFGVWGVVLTLLVPLQVGMSAYFFGNSMTVFLVEIGLIELGALMIGMSLGTLRVHSSTGNKVNWGGLAVVVPVCVILAAGPILAFYPALMVGYEGASLWPAVIFGTAFVTACLRHGRSLWQQAGTFNKTGEVATVDYTVGEGGIEVGPVENFQPLWWSAMVLYVAIPWGFVWVMGY